MGWVGGGEQGGGDAVNKLVSLTTYLCKSFCSFILSLFQVDPPDIAGNMTGHAVTTHTHTHTHTHILPGLSDGHVLPGLHLLVSVDDAGERVPAYCIQRTISLAWEGGRGEGEGEKEKRRGRRAEERTEGERRKEREEREGEKKREIVCSSSSTHDSTCMYHTTGVMPDQRSSSP